MQGVTFGNFHSYHDFGFFLASIEDIPPDVQENYVTVPYRNTLLDMTEAFGKITYKERKPRYKFAVIQDGNWDDIIRKVSDAIHGKRMKIAYDRDPDYYLIGRARVNNFESKKSIGTVTIDAVCDPFKYRSEITAVTFAVNGEREIMLANDRMVVYPKVSTTAEMQVVQGDDSHSFGVVSNHQSLIRLSEGENPLTLNGNGEITFIYQEGAL